MIHPLAIGFEKTCAEIVMYTDLPAGLASPKLREGAAGKEYLLVNLCILRPADGGMKFETRSFDASGLSGELLSKKKTGRNQFLFSTDLMFL